MVRKVLILYYSQFNNTARLAQLIQRTTDADMMRINVAKNIFPHDMQETDKVYKKQRLLNRLPNLINELPDLHNYDTILVGGPVWDGQVSSPIMSLLNKMQGYNGRVAPFSTGWSDTGKYDEDFNIHAGKLSVLPGYHVLTHASPHYSAKTLSSWLRKL